MYECSEQRLCSFVFLTDAGDLHPIKAEALVCTFQRETDSVSLADSNLCMFIDNGNTNRHCSEPLWHHACVYSIVFFLNVDCVSQGYGNL